MARRGQNGALYFAKPDTNISMLNSGNADFDGSALFDTNDGSEDGDVLSVVEKLGSEENPTVFTTDAGVVTQHETQIARDNRICQMGEWQLACVVSADRSSSAETSDASDRCNPDATVVTKITNEISGTLYKKRNADGTLPNWLKQMRNCFKNCTELYVMMLDRPKEASLGADGIEVDGWWMIGLVTEFSETQALNETIEISFTIVPSGQTTLYNNECLTCRDPA